MSYTVLARKYRSQTFDEVVGQGPIATTLVNAIKAGRIHHGYLFTGTRGVGKTSMARILAKALNCLRSEQATAKPCLECESCLAVAEGQDIDVVEIDAASNTGVDNIRELRGNAAYRPARARFKVYIIDEVHMLSTQAFNALLKTLEEPPPHVKFILATTEIQKVPATILSRCQNFNFRNISHEQIAEQLASIATKEGAKADPAVIRRVARLANGSMRDGLSILDQLLSLSPGKLSASLLDEVLPPVQDERIFAMLSSAADGDAAAVLSATDEILSQGRTLETFCNDVIQVVHALMLIKSCGVDSGLVDIPSGSTEQYAALAGRFELSQYVQIIAMLEELRRQVHQSAAARSLIDAVMVRVAKMRQWATIEELIAALPATAPDAGLATASRGMPYPATAGAGATSRSATTTPTPEEKKKTHDEPIASAKRSAGTLETQVARSMASPATAPQSGLADSVDSAGRAPDNSPANPTVESRRIEQAGRRTTDSQHASDSSVPKRALTAIPKPITADEKARIMRDPVVQKAVDLFSGRLVNIERRGSQPQPLDEERDE